MQVKYLKEYWYSLVTVIIVDIINWKKTDRSKKTVVLKSLELDQKEASSWN